MHLTGNDKLTWKESARPCWMRVSSLKTTLNSHLNMTRSARDKTTSNLRYSREWCDAHRNRRCICFCSLDVYVQVQELDTRISEEPSKFDEQSPLEISSGSQQNEQPKASEWHAKDIDDVPAYGLWICNARAYASLLRLAKGLPTDDCLSSSGQ